MNLTTLIRKFMAWWLKLPTWIGIPFIPLVMVIYLVAIIKNTFSRGDKQQ